LDLSRSTEGSDPTAILLREIAARAGTNLVASALQSFIRPNNHEHCDRTVAAFLNHRILTHLLRNLTMANYDLKTLSVSNVIWQECSTSTVVPPLSAGPDNRITLDKIAAVLDAHRELQRRILTLIAHSGQVPFLVLFGQGIALAHPGYSERFSHDIDLLVARSADGWAIVDALQASGFETTGARSGSYCGVRFDDWTLDAPDFDGHTMHVDISTNAITRSDGWMRPLVLTDLFDSAHAVTVPHLAPQALLVPSDSHQLLLLAEKVQRTQRYDYRVRCDATVLVRDGTFDATAVAEAARRNDIKNSLRWVLAKESSQLRESPPSGLRDRVSSILIAAMAHDTHHLSPRHGMAAKIFRRLYS